MNQFRSEHPNPQWERKTWRNLNGTWEFDFDFGASARDRKLYEQDALDQEIIVPFCPESALSGIGYKDFMASSLLPADLYAFPRAGGQGAFALRRSGLQGVCVCE